IPAQDVLHPVLQPQLLLLDLDFFELFLLAEEMAGCELVQAPIEFLMPAGQIAEFVIRGQQALPQFVRVDSHVPPPCKEVAGRTVSACPVVPALCPTVLHPPPALQAASTG